jgi:LPS export ABC transporter protein LptC
MYFLRSIVFFALFFTSLFVVTCSSPGSVSQGESREGRPDQESWGVTIFLTNEGLQRAVVRSGHLEKFSEKQYILLDQGVEADFYNTKEVHTTKLISQKAEVDEKSNFMTAIQAVTVESDSGVTLFTDTLQWNSELEMIYTDDPIMLTTENGDTLYGVGFESDVSLEHWKILNPSGVTQRGQDEK